MSKVTRTFFPYSAVSTIINQTSDDYVYARQGNIVIGQDAAINLDPTLNSHNVIIGHNAAQNIENGDDNIYIGFGVGTTDESQKLRIGNRTLAGDDIIVGTFDVSLEEQDLTFNAAVTVANTSQSSSKTTGALMVDGGLGVEKNVYIGGNTDITGTLHVDDTTDSSSITTGSTVIDGGVGIALKLYVGGNTRLQSSTTSTSTSSGSLVVSGGTGIAENLYVGGIGRIQSTTTSTSTSSGSLVVSGGMGLAENLYVGGVMRIQDSTDSTSSTTGALVVTGGVGIGKDLVAKELLQTRTGSDATSVPYILIPAGVILPYSSSSAPSGYLVCNGSAISRTTYAVLFTVVGTTYGSGDGSTTYNIPDLRGKVPTGLAGSGTFGSLNASGGSETHTLTTGEMPSHAHSGTTDSDGAHTHSITDPGHTHSYTHYIDNAPPGEATATGDDTGDLVSATTGSSTTGISIVSDGAHTHTFTTGTAGSGNAHNILQPYLVINYIIKY